jgi:hypothetical protein
MQRFKFRLLPALAAAALALSACESSKSVTAPAPADDNGFHTAAKAGDVVVRAPDLFVIEDANYYSNSTVIGSAGGTLSAGAATVVVPARTVPDGTRFTMNVSRNNLFEVSLTATSGILPDGINDIGQLGFRNYVLLYFNYGSPPPAGYSIAWQVSKHTLVPVPSMIDGNYVIGQLSHFSTYVVDSDYSNPDR